MTSSPSFNSRRRLRISEWWYILCLCFLLLRAAVSATVAAVPRADRRHTAATLMAATATTGTGTTLLTGLLGNEDDTDTVPWNNVARGGAEGPISAWLDGLKSGLASAMAAACVKTLLQPIDAIKTMQQYYHSTGHALSVVGACREIWNLGGFGKFYAGLGVTVIGAMPGVSLYFGVYQYCKKRLKATPWGERNPLVAVAASAAIGN